MTSNILRLFISFVGKCWPWCLKNPGYGPGNSRHKDGQDRTDRQKNTIKDTVNYFNLYYCHWGQKGGKKSRQMNNQMRKKKKKSSDSSKSCPLSWSTRNTMRSASRAFGMLRRHHSKLNVAAQIDVDLWRTSCPLHPYLSSPSDCICKICAQYKALTTHAVFFPESSAWGSGSLPW